MNKRFICLAFYLVLCFYSNAQARTKKSQGRNYHTAKAGGYTVMERAFIFSNILTCSSMTAIDISEGEPNLMFQLITPDDLDKPRVSDSLNERIEALSYLASTFVLSDSVRFFKSICFCYVAEFNPRLCDFNYRVKITVRNLSPYTLREKVEIVGNAFGHPTDYRIDSVNRVIAYTIHLKNVIDNNGYIDKTDQFATLLYVFLLRSNPTYRLSFTYEYNGQFSLPKEYTVYNPIFKDIHKQFYDAKLTK
jgi:hypothetical protein